MAERLRKRELIIRGDAMAPGQLKLKPTFHPLVAHHNDLRHQRRRQRRQQTVREFRGEDLHPVAREQMQTEFDGFVSHARVAMVFRLCSGKRKLQFETRMRSTASCINNETHSLASVRSASLPPRNSTRPSARFSKRASPKQAIRFQ